MSKLHLFNSENDLALGLGCRHYTPPPHAAALHRAGALLPAWWAEDGDTILAPAPTADEDARWLTDRFGLNVRSISAADSGLSPSPWGWSEDARRQFAEAGVPAIALPSDTALDRLRNLSHRRISIGILSRLGREDLPVMELTDPAEAVWFESQYPGAYYKSPWSCSGRGVFCGGGLAEKVLYDKCAGIIHRQGSVMAERGYEKESEFGSLFECRDGRAQFIGLSMFVTEPRGAYTGNIVARQSYFQDRINDLGLGNALSDTIAQLERILTDLIAPYYDGPLGIDMMAYRDTDGSIKLHPCIELNLRMTMGIAALHIARRLDHTVPMLVGWQRTAASNDNDIRKSVNATPLFIPGRALASPFPLLPPRDGFTLVMQPFYHDL